MSDQKNAQQRFDEKYISSGELCRVYGLDRICVMRARQDGHLPNPVRIGTTFIWEREALEPYLTQFLRKVRGDRRPM